MFYTNTFHLGKCSLRHQESGGEYLAPSNTINSSNRPILPLDMRKFETKGRTKSDSMAQNPLTKLECQDELMTAFDQMCGNPNTTVKPIPDAIPKMPGIPDALAKSKTPPPRMVGSITIGRIQ